MKFRNYRRKKKKITNLFQNQYLWTWRLLISEDKAVSSLLELSPSFWVSDAVEKLKAR